MPPHIPLHDRRGKKNPLKTPPNQATYPSINGIAREQTSENESNPREALGHPRHPLRYPRKEIEWATCSTIKVKRDPAKVASESGTLPCRRREALGSSSLILRRMARFIRGERMFDNPDSISLNEKRSMR